MSRTVVSRMVVVAAAVIAVSGCQAAGLPLGGADEGCAGSDQEGAVHVLQGGTYPIVGDVRAGINTVGDDHVATLTLMDGGPGGSHTVKVKVGDLFIAADRGFQVVEVCPSRVSLILKS
ncbi:hypothetical protein [Microbispora sp. NPDC049125]|uniref:hypothetical protein n=1 Tax=Microbispora sp. NPDC049125 TaxID=3154929 RepID=UPI0034669E2B